MLGSPGKTPFEIMGTRESAGAEAPAPESADPAGSVPTTMGMKAATSDWLVAAKTPLVLRLPRALYAGAALLLLFLLVIVFLVGRALGRDQGFEAGIRAAQHHRDNAHALQSIVSQRLTDGETAQEADAPVAGQGRFWGVSAGEVREAGQNYCLLGYWHEKEAVAVARYFAGRGVDVAVVPLKNGRLFHVAVVSAAIPSGDPDFQAKQNQAEVEIRRVLGDYLNETGGSRDMRNMLQWERFDGP